MNDASKSDGSERICRCGHLADKHHHEHTSNPCMLCHCNRVDVQDAGDVRCIATVRRRLEEARSRARELEELLEELSR